MIDRRLAVVLALVLVAGTAGIVIGLVSCQGDSGTAVPSGTGPGTPGSRSPFVAVLLPDTATPRWAEADAPAIDQVLSSAGIEHSIENAGGDSAEQRRQARQDLSRATVLLVAAVDGAAGAGIVADAHAAGVPVIAYDRPVTADYYAGFDAEAVGRLQADGLVSCLGDRGLASALVAEINGPAGDPVADVLAEGYKAVLGPKFADMTFTEVGEERASAWTEDAARAAFAGVLDRNGQVDGVLATSDALAAGTMAELESRGMHGIPVTGAGATTAAIQQILAGNQCMTVYRPIGPEANAAAILAARVGEGQAPNLPDSVLIGARRTPAVVPEAVAIDNDVQLLNDTVIRDGFVTWAQICTGGFREFCPPPSQRGSG